MNAHAPANAPIPAFDWGLVLYALILVLALGGLIAVTWYLRKYLRGADEPTGTLSQPGLGQLSPEWYREHIKASGCSMSSVSIVADELSRRLQMNANFIQAQDTFTQETCQSLLTSRVSGSESPEVQARIADALPAATESVPFFELVRAYEKLVPPKRKASS